jgi:hypothetical protein
MESAIRKILDSAVWAPSGDNSQPWSFVLEGASVRVYLDPKRDNPILNFNLSGTYIAHGALIENIALAAPLAGLAAEVELMPDPSDPLCTAKITFKEARAEADPLAYVIHDRHTNRLPYEKRALSPDAFGAFEAIAKLVPDAKLFLLDDRAAVRAAATSSALMEKVALETSALRHLFVTDILWSAEENRSGKQGLFIDTMELPPPARFAMRHISHSGIASFANMIGFSNIARISNARLYASGPALGLITIPAETPSAYLAAGRALERVWLEATRQHLAFQPVTGILFLARSIQHGVTEAFLPRHIEPILHANETIKDRFGASKEDIPAMLFRVGYAKPATARSFRRPPDIRVE